MANQPESPVWRAGVIQLELTTPVRGGPDGESNAPILALAERTAFLKQEVDAILAALPLLAPIASPDFTGTPQAVTPEDGDASRKIVTSEWVQALLRGVLTKALTGGNTALNGVEAGKGIIIFTGTLSSNATVTLPAVPGRWIVANRTTGAFTLTVRSLGGAGVALSQGRVQSVWSDGTDLLQGVTEISNLAMTGVPTAPSAEPTDSSEQVATNRFARRFARGATTIVATGNATITLTDTQAAAPVLLLTGSPVSAFTVVFPAEGARWNVVNSTGQTATLKTAAQTGGVTIAAGRNQVVMADGASIRSAPSQTHDVLLSGAPTATTPAQAAAATEVVTAEWVRALLAGQSIYTTGDIKVTLKATPDVGWLFLDGRTIGASGSGATARANADTAALYALIWTNLADAQAPVIGGRGGSASADFAALKPITLPSTAGRAIVGAGSGASLTPRTLGAVFGAEAHTLSAAQMPEHAHGGATGSGGAHGHTLTIDAAGAHTHTAAADAAGQHSHGARTDRHDGHRHKLSADQRSVVPATFPQNIIFEPDGNPTHPIDTNTDIGGAHEHTVNVDAAGQHGHNVTVQGAGSHAHGGSVTAADNHAHTISPQGGNEPHPNVQPSIAFNVMVKL